jgi:hypothetical protein
MAVSLLLFSQVDGSGLIEEIQDLLRSICRKESGRKLNPSLGLIDKQSVKAPSMSMEKGYDGGRKIKGRKRHIVTDTLGLLMATVIHSADIQDRKGSKLVMEQLRYKSLRLKKYWLTEGTPEN